MYMGLQGLLDEFGASITKSKYNSYMPILKNSFIPFLNDKYSKEIEKSMDRFFGIMISTRDIIDGGINYVDNTKKVVGEAAIDKYLTATNMFFKDVIYPKWPNCQLSTVESFKVFYDDIRENCGKELKGYSPRAHLEDDDYEGLLEYLDEIIYVFLTIFLYLPKCPQSLILSALRAFCFCGKPRISRSIFLYFPCQSWLKSW